MKIGKRILFFLHWLLSVIAVASIVLQEQTQQLTALLTENIGEHYAHIAFIAAIAVYAVLSFVCLILIVKRESKRGERGFITMDSSDNGRVRIAINAVEQMVRRAIEKVDGIAEAKIAISNRDDALNVTVKAMLAGGAHVPTVTMNIQRAIRQYVEMNCGVAVCAVSVNVQSISNTVEVSKAPTVSETEKPIAQAPAIDLHSAVEEAISEQMNEEAENSDVVCEEACEPQEESVGETEENEQ